LANIFFPDGAIEKTNQKFSCTDEAMQYPKVQKFHRCCRPFLKMFITAILKIVLIKTTEFSSQFGRKIGAAEEKSLAP
jgi:hypothetical protein